MKKILIALLLSLFVPFFTAMVFETKMMSTGLFSVDKIIKTTLMFIAIVAFLTRFKRIPKNVLIYIVPCVAWLIVLQINNSLSESSEVWQDFAQKEFFRLGFLLVVFLLSSSVVLGYRDLRWLVVGLSFLGAMIGAASVWNSLTGETTKHWTVIEGVMRAGQEFIPTNNLAAVLNIVTMIAIAGFLCAAGRVSKLLFLICVVTSQAGRFMTLSTGGTINIVVSLGVSLILVYKYRRQKFNELLKLYTFLFLSAVVVIIFYDMSGMLFYRLSMSDESIWRSSVWSRLEQYENYLYHLSSEPWRIVTGWGSATVAEKVTTGVDFHNSFLRPLASAGVFGFGAYLSLNYFVNRDFKESIAGSVGKSNGLIIICIFGYSSFLGWTIQSLTLPGDAWVSTWFLFILGYIMKRSVHEIDANDGSMEGL